MRVFILDNYVESMVFSNVSLNVMVYKDRVVIEDTTITDNASNKFIYFDINKFKVFLSDIKHEGKYIGTIESFNGYKEKIIILPETANINDIDDARIMKGSFNDLLKMLTPTVIMKNDDNIFNLKYRNVIPCGKYKFDDYALSPYTDIMDSVFMEKIRCVNVATKENVYDDKTKTFNLEESGKYIIFIGENKKSETNFLNFNNPIYYHNEFIAM